MKKFLRIFSVVLMALLGGAGANLAFADPDSGWGGRGPGMMGGYGPGYGMGPGMMGGYGYGMGPGMMGYGDYRGLNLSREQQGKIAQIRKETRSKMWALMDDMIDAQDKLQDLYDTDKQDATAINTQYKVIEDLRRQMVDIGVDTNNRINAILTKEQREKLRERGRGYGPMMRGY
ncbi:MAG TPA: Spy/CpxP family protein refolding chaperone [Gallionellaceae bacterium]